MDDNQGSPPQVLYSTGEEIRGQFVSEHKSIAFDVVKDQSRVRAMDFDPVSMIVLNFGASTMMRLAPGFLSYLPGVGVGTVSFALGTW